MLLPNADRAVVDMAKLRGYCLNAAHEDGQHKARVFAAALGLYAKDAELLRDALLETVKTHEAVATKKDRHGQRYTVDFEFHHLAKTARVRSSWIIHPDEDFPRLTSCYVI